MKNCLFIKITVDSDSIHISTKRKCFKACWNVKAGRAEGKADCVKSINAYLDTLQQKVFEAKRRLIELNTEITPSNIKDLMLGKNVNRQRFMLMDMFKHHNEQMKALVGSEYAKGTLERYETSLKHRLNFPSFQI